MDKESLFKPFENLLLDLDGMEIKDEYKETILAYIKEAQDNMSELWAEYLDLKY